MVFQSTPPRGGRRYLYVVWKLESLFQSTPPRGGRPDLHLVGAGGGLFQSTPPRGGRPDRHTSGVHFDFVSIHAPARGATSYCPSCSGSKSFQSTPPRGGRPRILISAAPAVSFQSTPPRGGRRVAEALADIDHEVSIHAPARGATQPRGYPGILGSFNPRPRAGGDQRRRAGGYSIFSFNPRPRAGGDLSFCCDAVGKLSVSIHAPARGATSRRNWKC